MTREVVKQKHFNREVVKHLLCLDVNIEGSSLTLEQLLISVFRDHTI